MMEEPNLQADLEDEEASSAQAVKEIIDAHHLLKSLRGRLGASNRHTEIDQAITKLEVALSALTVNTGGMC